MATGFADGQQCTGCGKAVAALSEGFGLSNGMFFHKQCFVCAHCTKPFPGEFMPKDNKVYHKSCYTTLFAPKCVKCSGFIEGPSLPFRGEKYHPTCFVCFGCNQTLAQKPFSEVEGNLYCSPCSTEKLAKQMKDTGISNPDERIAIKTSTQEGGQKVLPLNNPTSDTDNLVNCEACKKTIFPKQPNVMLHSNKGFHTECFVCASCNKGFDDLKFSQANGKYYHKDCLIEISSPKCSSCSKPLISGYITWREQKLHPECFNCNTCGAQLSGKPYSETPEGNRFCDSCASKQEKKASLVPEKEIFCWKCNELVVEGVKLSGNRVIHAKCFTCASCGKEMANVQALAEKNNKLFHPECFAATFAELCHKCNKPMSDGYVPYKGHNYHPDCLGCIVCNKSIVGISFTETPKGQPICRECNAAPKVIETERTTSYNPMGLSTNPMVPENKGIGTYDRCPRCKNKVFMNDQVMGPRATYWHRKCLHCEVCTRNLDTSATIIGDEVYCNDHKPK